MRRRTTVLLAGAALLVGIPGGAYLLDPDRGHPYADELAQARHGASTFQRDVLYDGTISDDELADARRLWRECLYDNDLSPARADTHPGGPIAARCHATTIGDLEGLHHAMTIDPENKGFPVVLAECLQRKGLLPDGYDPADYEHDDLVADMTERLEDPGVRACFANPAAA